jgi:pseudouridine synthase
MPQPKPVTSFEPLRLNFFLAQYAGVSRRQADTLISQGRVKVNGQTAHLGQKVSPQNDSVTLNNQPVSVVRSQYYYLMLHKPVGYITTTRDQFGRPSVVDLIPQSPRLYPVGRLDYATSGLLIFTNDGQLALRLTHPRYHFPKTYQVTTTRSPSPSHIRQLETGVRLEDGLTHPAIVRLLPPASGGFAWQITITEGRNRQIRRMCDSLGLKLLSLTRVSVGPLRLGALPPGRFRSLTLLEIKQLKKVVQ